VYGAQAVEKHGLMGVVMMVDRILRETEDMRSRKRVRTEAYDRLFDPVEDNDYWFGDSGYPSYGGGYYARELVREWTGTVGVNQ
jgi:hypothetical protein